MQAKYWNEEQHQFSIMEIDGKALILHAYKEILLYAYGMQKLGCSKTDIRKKFGFSIDQVDRFWRDCNKLVEAIENGDDAENVVF